ncbi:Unknown protein sequence [Pseudomonas amygdali pv. myricae]|nr:Unknown protein sequence [Pseudomonas amygdali pv. myricae]
MLQVEAISIAGRYNYTFLSGKIIDLHALTPKSRPQGRVSC